MRVITITILISLFVSFFSCTKEAGEGGTASISGKIKVREKDASFVVTKEEYYAADEDVFIIYGDDTIPADDAKTSFDGAYRFDHLQKGIYTIYALSKDTIRYLNPVTLSYYYSEKKIPKKVTVEITEKGQNVLASDIIIIN